MWSCRLDLTKQLNESRGFLFTPNQAWKRKLYQVVRQATGELGIKISGLHRLRSNDAQGKYLELRKQGRILGEISQSLEAGPFCGSERAVRVVGKKFILFLAELFQ